MNALLAQLDRRLRARGESVFLQRKVGTTNQSVVQCELRAIVRALTVEQLVGGIGQQQYFIITSPTFIYRAQWPGGRTPAATGSIIAPTDPRIPITSDKLVVRGAEKAIQRVAPVFDRGECVRLEITVLG